MSNIRVFAHSYSRTCHNGNIVPPTLAVLPGDTAMTTVRAISNPRGCACGAAGVDSRYSRSESECSSKICVIGNERDAASTREMRKGFLVGQVNSLLT